MLERVSHFVFSGKCLVQVNQVSITKACFRTQEAECDVGQSILTQQTELFLRCAMQIFVKTLTRKTVTFDVEGQ